jgi:16S rRNA (guanine1516-N2)-methyltransferase
VTKNEQKIFVLCDENNSQAESLSKQLEIPLITRNEINSLKEGFFLAWREDRLALFDIKSAKKGLSVEFDVRSMEQPSWPAPKTGSMAQAIGKKNKIVVDATAGWGQDSFHIFRMGYQVESIERSRIMAALLTDGFLRLESQHWMQQLNLKSPRLMTGNAIEILQNIEYIPDCIYLDPMFPAKRKKSALAKKPLVVLRAIVGDDEDKNDLFACALQVTAKRVVVKSPNYAEPLGGKPDQSFAGKLVRYDVYFKK